MNWILDISLYLGVGYALISTIVFLINTISWGYFKCRKKSPFSREYLYETVLTRRADLTLRMLKDSKYSEPRYEAFVRIYGWLWSLNYSFTEFEVAFSIFVVNLLFSIMLAFTWPVVLVTIIVYRFYFHKLDQQLTMDAAFNTLRGATDGT